MSRSAILTINIDGAARGNPGPAAFAYVIARDGQLLCEEAGCLGTATNNSAEYTALVRALERAAELGGERLLIRSDSELLVKQMNGLYRVKNPQLKVLHDQAARLREQFAAVSVVHVPRAENRDADRLCNEALDGLRETIPSAASDKNGSSDRDASQEDVVREQALACLRAAASAWVRRDPAGPTPEQVWEQIRDIIGQGRS
jgi:ribonuclease HI